MTQHDSQKDIIDYLSRPDCPAFTLHLPAATGVDSKQAIDVVHTHSAHVFIGQQVVCKIKRAVRYSYLDMRALETRHKLCLREFEINQPVLPDVYIDVVPVYRSGEGHLCMEAVGTLHEWILRMYRFEQSQVLDTIAREERLTNRLARQLGDSMALYHSDLSPCKCNDGWQRIREIIDELAHEFTLLGDILPLQATQQFGDCAGRICDRHRNLLDQRAVDGLVRRCHGDLHLRNILLKDGRAVPFDALEFDERLATTDIFYDIAFLIMDLGHRNLLTQQNEVLNSYLLRFEPVVFDGLAALRLFLAIRAGIRAMTTAQSVRQVAQPAAELHSEAVNYLNCALAYLAPAPPRLVLIGGLSGSGKSTLARQLATRAETPPGAILLHSDAERKALRGAARRERLAEEHYTRNARKVIYRRLYDKALRALKGGFTVVLDATWLSEADRATAADLADEAQTPLIALWLDAPLTILRQRVYHRGKDEQRFDASDATVEVLEQQARNQPRVPSGWTTLDASGPSERTLAEALQALAGAESLPTRSPTGF